MNYIESQGLSTYMTNLTYTEKYLYLYKEMTFLHLKNKSAA